MARQKHYRQRATWEASSIQAKTLFQSIKTLVKKKQEVSVEEAHLIATDALPFLDRYLCKNQLGTVEIPAVVLDTMAYFRRGRFEQNEKMVNLTIVADEDAELYKEFGLNAMVLGRLARVIEEALFQGALLDLKRLVVLFPSTGHALSRRVQKLISQGAKLPLAGMSKTKREKFKALRGVLAIERYLDGESLANIRKSLCISQIRWQEWWNCFRMTLELKEHNPEEIAQILSQPVELISDWLGMWESRPDRDNPKLQEELTWSWPIAETTKSYNGFLQLLQDRHSYTVAAAESFVAELKEKSNQFAGKERTPHQIIYIGVSTLDGAGRSLDEVHMVPVVLDYLTPKDWDLADRDNPKNLRWERILRFTTQAYEQGVALNLPDLAYLLSISVDTIRALMKENSNIILPTRGQVADIGTALSHSEKIIDLFMYGYTETEIERRCGHTLDSIERYLIDFGKIVYLIESGMPLPAIRKVTGFSKKLVEKYHSLYDKYSNKDFIFPMAKIRRFGIVQKKKKVVSGMKTGKRSSKFSTLATRDLITVQIAHLKTRFELAEESFLGERAVHLVNEALDVYEKENNIIRVKPGELLVESKETRTILPLLIQEWVSRLDQDMYLSEVKSHHEYEQFTRLQAIDHEATYGDLWSVLGRNETGRKRAPKEYDFLLPEPLDSAAIAPLHRQPEDLVSIPSNVAKTCLNTLVDDYGCKKGQAEAMVRFITGIRAWICPEESELYPGQAVWLAYGNKKFKKTDPKLFVPLILTILTPNEQSQEIKHRGEFKTLKITQIERITTEAWKQDGVLTTSDTEWLLGISPNLIRKLLEAYQEKFGIILPTAGTVLDMGPTLTHKKIVVEMSLAGMTTQQIADRVFHSTISVDRYLRTFENLLVMMYYNMPMSAIYKVLGHSPKLIEEHMKLAEEHFPTEEALEEYLHSRGVALEKTS